MILDCCTFFNELDILEIRLTELYPVVDKFILVEATKTHKGDPKPLYYAENRQRFARWNDKILQVTVGDLPDGTSQAAIWRREIQQRQAISRALSEYPQDAIVMVSDLDEIPRREVVQMLPQVDLDDLVVTFDQTLYYYNVNTSCTNIRWNGTRATLNTNVATLSPDGVRWSGLRSMEYPRLARVANAGWHLSYFGDVAHIQSKMRGFLHQELVNDDTLDPDLIARRMAAGIDIWGRETEQAFTIGPASDLPTAIRCEPSKWLKYFHPDWRPEFHENWYTPEQAAAIGYLARHAPEGAMVEIGCWEGRSSVALAQCIAPRVLHCVDTWQGDADTGPVDRDVLGTFVGNMDLMTAGNWEHTIADWRDWAARWFGGSLIQHIAFLHLDGPHDYDNVHDCLRAVLPFIVLGGIVCGDDLYSDGVYRAVHDVFGDTVQDYGGRMWAWRKE